MKLMRHVAVSMFAAAFALGGMAVQADAQPEKRKERRENRKERRKDRRDKIKDKIKEKREDVKENREERREARKERPENWREKRKERREKWRTKRARHKELKEKAGAGGLSDEEKAELEGMEKRHAARVDRHKALKKKLGQLKKNHKKRRREARRRLHTKYPNLHKHPAAVAEFRTHARRMARLKRAKAVANAEGRDGLEKRIDELIEKERARHQTKVAKHKAKWTAAKEGK